MNVFLSALAERYQDDHILLILDNAAWHTSHSLRVPDNTELFPLLPYTPELNPIEQIWEDIREKGFRNEAFRSLDAVELRLCDTLCWLADRPNRVASITHRSWLDIECS